MSFPRRRESRFIQRRISLDTRFRGYDGAGGWRCMVQIIWAVLSLPSVQAVGVAAFVELFDKARVDEVSRFGVLGFWVF